MSCAPLLLILKLFLLTITTIPAVVAPVEEFEKENSDRKA